MSENASLWIVRDPDGNAWGPFEKASEAGKWAQAKWPLPHRLQTNLDPPWWNVEVLETPR